MIHCRGRVGRRDHLEALFSQAARQKKPKLGIVLYDEHCRLHNLRMTYRAGKRHDREYGVETYSDRHAYRKRSGALRDLDRHDDYSQRIAIGPTGW
jgi:hypothetical protein